MKFRVASLFLASAFVCVATARAQLRAGTTEINGFGGWLFGSEIAHVHDINDNNFDHPHVDVADDAAYGGRIGYNFTSVYQFEFEYSRTQSNFELHSNLPDQNLGNFRIEYFMANNTFNFGHRRVVPFFTIGAGAAHLTPNLPGTFATDEVRFTTSAGGGVKFFVNPHFAFRFDGRFYSTWLGDHSRVFCDTAGFCDTRSWLPTFTTTGGLVIAF